MTGDLLRISANVLPLSQSEARYGSNWPIRAQHLGDKTVGDVGERAGVGFLLKMVPGQDEMRSQAPNLTFIARGHITENVEIQERQISKKNSKSNDLIVSEVYRLKVYIFILPPVDL